MWVAFACWIYAGARLAVGLGPSWLIVMTTILVVSIIAWRD